MKSGSICFLLFGLLTISAYGAENKLDNDTTTEEQSIAPPFVLADSLAEENATVSDSIYIPKKRKLKAVLLSVLLGHFGVHRIYLGTSANVPVAYSLTLGGGLGLLPLIDTILILKSNDLNEFSNNEKVIMWSKERSTQP